MELFSMILTAQLIHQGTDHGSHCCWIVTTLFTLEIFFETKHEKGTGQH
jgi:hypothetical protein